MSDSLYVNDNGTPVPLNLGTGIEFVERIEALEQENAEQDEAISSKVATVNGLTPDANGNVDVGGMPLGTLFPYTGKDVPAGTLRADGSTYTNMRESFPEFYEWVVASGLTVALGSYTLVEGSCGYYGLDEAAGTVRMPTLAAGVFGTVEAGKYGQAVQAGLPDITGHFAIVNNNVYFNQNDTAVAGAFFVSEGQVGNVGNYDVVATGGGRNIVGFEASRSSRVYRGDIDTVTPSHVKYPWVIVVYNAAVPPSVAQAGEFVELLDGKVGVNAENFTAEGKSFLVGLGMPSGRRVDMTVGANQTQYTAPANGYFYANYQTTQGTSYDFGLFDNGGLYGYRTAGGALPYDGKDHSVTLPVHKGQVVKVLYSGGISLRIIRFIYAEGEEA